MTEALPAELPVLPSWKLRCSIAAGFAALLFLVHGASLRNDFVRFDDGLLIYENPAIRSISPSSLTTIFTTYDPELYIPLTLFSYQLDYQLGGTDPFVYHLHNLILHTLNAILVAWFVYLLSGKKWLAVFVSLFFAIHPLHVEAVAWASARKDLLSTLFFLSSLIAYLYYTHRATSNEQPPAPELRSVRGAASNESPMSSGRRYYGASLALFLLGLLSKVMVVTLPVVLLLLDWRNGRKVDRSLFLDKVPYLSLSLLFGVIALFGKRAVTAEATLFQTLLMAAKSTAFYLQKLFAPTGLSVLYPYTDAIRAASPDFFLPLLVLLVLFVLFVFSLRFTRELLFGFLCFVITLLPTFVNFSKGGDFYFASDRYAYLPSVGMLFALGWVLLWFPGAATRAQVARKRCIGVAALTALVALLFSVLTVRQSLVFRDTETLFRNVLLHYPNSHRARNNLANAFRRKGKLPEAIQEFKAALAIREHPKTLSNLGAVYRKLGRIPEAVAIYEKALAIAPDDPEPHFGLGVVYAQQGDFPKALDSYEHALALDPEYVDVHNNMGALYAQEGQFDRAAESYRKALAINPLYYQAHYNLGVALESLERLTEAMRAYAEAIHLEPTFTPARINLAILLYGSGRMREAEEHFREVLTIDPGNPRATAALKQLEEHRE